MIADNSSSKGFETDNNEECFTITLVTSPVVSNVNIIGTISQDPAFDNTSY